MHDRAHGLISRGERADNIAGIQFGGGEREIKLRLLEGVDAIERLAFLDAVADLLEDLDARALIDAVRRRYAPGG